MTYADHTPPPSAASAAPDARMPGIGAAAAVLGFVEGSLGLAFVAYLLTTLAGFGGAGDDEAAVILFLLAVIAISGLLLLGSLFLVRRSGRRLLIGATIAEVVIVFGLGIWALADSSSVYGYGSYSYDSYDYGYPSTSGGSTALVVALIAVLMAALALPVVRLVLAAQPAVGSWLRGRPPAAPVWSPEAQQWVPAPRRGAGTVLAVMAPVALLAVASIIVVSTAEHEVDYGIADAPASPGVVSDYSYLYDDGDPVEPPTSSDPEFEATYDDDAQDCYDGDLGACDDLYSQTPVGSLYEWLGSTCGGRSEQEMYGTCE